MQAGARVHVPARSLGCGVERIAHLVGLLVQALVDAPHGCDDLGRQDGLEPAEQAGQGRAGQVRASGAPPSHRSTAPPSHVGARDLDVSREDGFRKGCSRDRRQVRDRRNSVHIDGGVVPHSGNPALPRGLREERGRKGWHA